MTTLLLINAGSSSLKWQLMQLPEAHPIAHGQVERLNLPDSIVKVVVNGKKTKLTVAQLDEVAAINDVLHRLVAMAIIPSLSAIDAVGHRVVAGGTVFQQAIRLTDDRLLALQELSELAPLHNPLEVRCIELLMASLPGVPQYAVFDSAYFHDLPEETAIYGIPYEWSRDYQIRRYGEHGISHRYLAQRAALELDRPLSDLNLITLHLGSGASITAVKQGRPVDTSMGLTPVTGLIMGTRSGDVDPSLVPYLMKRLNLKTPEEVITRLNTESGLLGVSGISSDMRDLHEAAATNARAALALEMFITQVVKFVGAYYVELGGADALIFAGGIGEKDELIRQEIIDRLAVLGIGLDDELNAAGEAGELSSPESAAKVLLLPTNEELAMAHEIQDVMDSELDLV